MTKQLRPIIYVACLAAYNAGHLHGQWLNAARDADDIYADIREMLAKSPEPNAEEWAIHDYEDFGDIRIAEYKGIPEVSRLALCIAEHGAPFAGYANYVDTDYATPESFLDAYCGQYVSEREYAEELFDELYLHEIPEHARGYLDYDAFARDLFCGDYFSVEAHPGVFIFHSY